MLCAHPLGLLRRIRAGFSCPEALDLRMTRIVLACVCSAKQIGIVAFGEGKAEVVQRVLEVQSLPGALPAQMVRATNGAIKWFLDIAAAQHLSIHKWESTKDFPRSN
jgi:6-phosphogluconolactonase